MKYLLHIILLSICIAGQTQEVPPELVTDRPDQTESSSVVPMHSLQIETGFILETKETLNQITKSYKYSTTLFRYGLFENFELRLGLNYEGERFKTLQGDEIAHNLPRFSPLFTGFKVMVTNEKGWLPELAFLGALVLPFTAPKVYQPSHPAANMRFAATHTLTDRISLGYNLGAEWDGDSSIPSYFYSAVLGIGLSDKIGMFVESYGLLADAGTSEHLADAGFTYALTHKLQLDISGGFGLNDVAIDNFISCGLSLRLPE